MLWANYFVCFTSAFELPKATILKVIYKNINKDNYTHTITAVNPTHIWTVPTGKHDSNLYSTERESDNTIISFHFTHTLHPVEKTPKYVCSRWKSSRVFRFPLSYSLSLSLLGDLNPFLCWLHTKLFKSLFRLPANFCRLIWLCIMLKWENNPSWDFSKDFSKALSLHQVNNVFALLRGQWSSCVTGIDWG